MSFLVLTVSIGHFGVSCQYIQYRPNSASSLSARLAAALSDKRFDTTPEYEYYYDDEIDDFGTTQTFAPTTATKTASTATTTTTTTTSTTTTPKPISSYRLLTTQRNGFRPLVNFNSKSGNTKKKSDTSIARQSNQFDSYTEASNDSAFVQKQTNNQPKQSASTQHQRNAISDVSRRSASKDDYAEEKSAPAAIESGGGFSRRYARFLFKLRSG